MSAPSSHNGGLGAAGRGRRPSLRRSNSYMTSNLDMDDAGIQSPAPPPTQSPSILDLATQPRVTESLGDIRFDTQTLPPTPRPQMVNLATQSSVTDSPGDIRLDTRAPQYLTGDQPASRNSSTESQASETPRTRRVKKSRFTGDAKKTIEHLLPKIHIEKMASVHTGLSRMLANVNAPITPGHFLGMIKNMHQKKKELVFYHETKNVAILHLDWAAGNPNDPIRQAAIAAERAKMDAAQAAKVAATGKPIDPKDECLTDIENMEKISRMVARITFGVPEIDATNEWNKTLMYGDWLHRFKYSDAGKLIEVMSPEYFVEIQIKRVSGSDAELMEKCGVNPKFAFLALQENAVEIIKSAQAAKAAVEAKQKAAQDEAAARATRAVNPAGLNPFIPKSPAFGNFPTSMSNKDGGSKPGQSSKPTGTATATATATATGGQAASAAAHDDDRGDGNVDIDQYGASVSDDEDYQSIYTDSNGTVSEAMSILSPHVSVDTRALAADLKRVRAQAAEADAAMDAVLPKDDAHIQRMKDSSVYVVRVVAIPESPRTVNRMTGPPVAERRATLLGSGGWVMPPMAERRALRDAHPRQYRKLLEKKYAGLPKAMAHRALPVQMDVASQGVIGLRSDPAPIWSEVSDPTLEDVYWLVWEMMSGREFAGFRRGFRFGWDLYAAENAAAVAQAGGNPFQSPSVEAMRHAANQK